MTTPEPAGAMVLGPAEAGAARCPVCGDDASGPMTACDRCDTPHHSECWNFNEGCAVFGCKAALAALEREAEELVRVDPEVEEVRELTWLDRAAGLPAAAWTTIGFLVFAAGLTGIGLSMWVKELAWVRYWIRYGTGGGLLWSVLTFGPGLVSMTGILGIAGGSVIHDHVRDIVHGPRRFRLPEETPLKVLEARLGADPRNLHLLEMVAFHYFADDRYEDAQDLYDRSLKLNPNQPRTAYLRAKCLERRGYLAEAKQAFTALTGGHASKDIQEKAAWFEGVLARRLHRGEPPEPPREASGPFEEIEERGGLR